MISDVVCESDPDPTIRNDVILREECIAGTSTQQNLLSILDRSPL